MTESCPEVGKHAIALLPFCFFCSEDRTLESAVVRVINPGEPRDGDDELGFPESSSSLVLKELLREAPELLTQQLAHLLRGEGCAGKLNGLVLGPLMQRVRSILGLTIPLKTPGSFIRDAGSKEFVKE